MKDTLVLIPARSGSKGIKNKNFRILNGKPLIEYTLDFALKFFPKKNIIVSSNCKNVINICSKKVNIHFTRPDIISDDNTKMSDVINHAVSFVRSNNLFFFNKLLLLQPTLPIRNEKDLIRVFSKLNHDTQLVKSVTRAQNNPEYNMMFEDENGYLKNFSKNKIKKRQDSKEFYSANGSMYLYAVKEGSLNLSKILRVKKVVMDKISSLDIDDEYDWSIVSKFIK